MPKSIPADEGYSHGPWPPVLAGKGVVRMAPTSTVLEGGKLSDDDAIAKVFGDGAKLLIVEDEFLIGQDLLHGPMRDGIEVLGPYDAISSAIDALGSNQNIGAAILDLNIRGHVAFDLAEKLAERNIPFIFYTGYDSVIVPEKFRDVGRVRKPADWRDIKRALFGNTTGEPASRRIVKQASAGMPDLASILPVLRHRAREITANAVLADRLVERTLERAIREIAGCPAGVAMDRWLIGLIETTGIGDGRHLN